MTPAIKNNANRYKILRRFYVLTNAQTNEWYDLRQIANELKITQDEFEPAYESLKADRFIEQYGAGYTATLAHGGILCVQALDEMEEQEIVLKTLSFLRPYRYEDVNIWHIFDASGLMEHEQYRIDVLNNLINLGLVKQATHDIWFVKISEKGWKINSSNYDSIHEKQSQTSDHFSISGSHNTIIFKSPNSNIKFSDEELKVLIPKLIDLFNDIRTEDLVLLSAAIQDLKEGKPVDTTVTERITSFIANMSTVLTSFAQA